MRRLLSFAAATAMLAGAPLSAQAVPFAASALGSNVSHPALVQVADGCGPGRFRGVGGYCQGHRPITIRKVCTARRYAGALVRRCRVVRM